LRDNSALIGVPIKYEQKNVSLPKGEQVKLIEFSGEAFFDFFEFTSDSEFTQIIIKIDFEQISPDLTPYYVRQTRRTSEGAVYLRCYDTEEGIYSVCFKPFPYYPIKTKLEVYAVNQETDCSLDYLCYLCKKV